MMSSLPISCRADDADKHSLDVNHLTYHKGKLYSASDDGKIKCWTDDLTKLSEVQADLSSVYALAAGPDTLYSCSNDGTVKAWSLETLQPKGVIVEQKDTEYWKVYFNEGKLYVGDDEGNVSVYINDTFYGKVNVAHPVKDLVVDGHVLFTVKDTDVEITDLKFSVTNEELQYGFLKSYMGRLPLALMGRRYIAFATRDGKEILIHENNHEDHYKEVMKIQQPHELIINALSGAVWNNEHLLFSGGWDKTVKKWKVDKNLKTLEGSTNVEFVINTITPGDSGLIYAAGGDGHIVRINAS